MNESLLILSEDAVFSRMLELEFRMQRISARALRHAEEGCTARVILVDLDTALPPSDCDGRVIGFTRSFSILASDPERRCSMILHRPFSMELLTDEVRALLGYEETSSFATEPVSGRARLSLKEGTLVYGSRSQTLSPTEVRVMECLLSARGQAVSRQTIDGVIGTSAANKTDVYICLLRKKLEALTGNPTIRTVRGVGYRID
jgi:hypothetical protein